MASIAALELLVLLLLLAGAVIAGARMRRASWAVERGRIVRTTWWVALSYGVVVAVGTLLRVVQVLADDTVTVEAPIQEFWPTLPKGMEVDGGSGPALLVHGVMTRASLEVAGLETSTRTLLAAGELVSGLTIGAVVALVMLACRNIGRGTPFAPTMARACALAAWVVVVGSLLAQLLDGIGTNRAAEAALRWTSASWSCRGKGCDDIDPARYLPESNFFLHFDLWPLAVALVLGVIAVLLRSGTALQRDTEGLV